MLKSKLCQVFRRYIQIVNSCQTKCARGFQTTGVRRNSNIRNIGIMAHIDAGKTTTTERMLYYAGFIKRMGDIDTGTTVMDYLPSERQRGITVQSAAISINWLDCHINLIDTPGHVDFTIEVERSLRVLDGAIAIFDSSRGVEAQTRTVWRQADQNNIPRIAFLNKMDKQGASFSASLKSIQKQLNVETLKLQLPLVKDNSFVGVIDVIKMEEIEWDMSDLPSNNIAREFQKRQIKVGEQHWDLCISAREQLIETLSELCDDVASAWLDGPYDGDASAVAPDLLQDWIRRATLANLAVPVLCGISLKNVGVQPLLDAVVTYLPRPGDVMHSFTRYYPGGLVAMAFKVLHDQRYGTLVFVRVYSGTLKANSTIFNPNKSCTEPISKVLSVFADDYKESGEIPQGGIGIVTGLKQTITGDTIVASQADYNAACERAAGEGESPDEDCESDASSAVLTSVPVPDPVFFRSITAENAGQEDRLEKALALICREDPSVLVRRNDDWTYTISGMGELHLDIVAERIRRDLKVKVIVGEVKVAYRESPTVSSQVTESSERTIANRKHNVDITVGVRPTSNHTPIGVNSVRGTTGTSPEVMRAAAIGVAQECHRGSVLGFPLIGARLKIHALEVNRGIPAALVTAAAARCTRRALAEAGCQIVEPVMDVEVTTREKSLGPIMSELARRSVHVTNVSGDAEEGVNVISGTGAVAEVKDLASSLRSATSGNADLWLQVSGYQPASEARVQKIKKSFLGIDATWNSAS